MEIPKNCIECKCSTGCTAPYYGSTICKYGKDINRVAIEAMLHKDAKAK